MDSTTVGKYMPIFKEKLGKGVPMEAIVRFKDIKVKFAEYDTDVILQYTVGLRFEKDTGTKRKGTDHEKMDTLFYDEFKVVTTGSVKTKDDVLYIEILSHKLDNNSKYA